MEFSVKSFVPENQVTDCIVVGVFESKKLSATAEGLDRLSGGALLAPVKRGDFRARPGETCVLADLDGPKAKRVLLVGCGKEDELDEARFEKAVSGAIRALRGTSSKQALFCLGELDVADRDYRWRVRRTVEIACEADYRFDELKSKKNRERVALKKITIHAPRRGDVRPGQNAVQEGRAIAGGMALAKDLGNLPGNVCTPSYLASQARALKRKFSNLKVKVLGESEMERLGMGALLSVSRGSRQPAKLIVIQYPGGTPSAKPYVLVGKGITFDSGGISIKPGAAMDEMKFDMCGAASVLGTLSAVAELALPVNVVGIIASSENLPDGNASKPGDIVTSMSGQTIEVLNTDAEGRLVLCDALTYAERFKPAAVVDIATLTGACVIALGNHASGLLGNHEPLVEDLLDAGNHAGDRAWQLPLWDDYQKQLDSNFADMANIGGRAGGTITAACFLSRFTGKYHWAHLDIAGTAWKSGKEKGATGRPVPLLTQFLINHGARKRR